jgi:hypothetical protein
VGRLSGRTNLSLLLFRSLYLFASWKLYASKPMSQKRDMRHPQRWLDDKGASAGSSIYLSLLKRTAAHCA